MYLWKRKEERQRLKAATIPNPRIKDLLKLPIEEQEEIINVFLKVKGNALGYYESILNVQYYKISNIRKILANDTDVSDTIEIVKILTGLSYKKILKLRTLDLIKLHIFVKDGFVEIQRLESTLSRKHEAAEVRAGIENMNKYSELIGLKTVMDFYNETIEASEKRTYGECFIVWSYNSDKAEFDKNYFKIKTAKHGKG